MRGCPFRKTARFFWPESGQTRGSRSGDSGNAPSSAAARRNRGRIRETGRAGRKDRRRTGARGIRGPAALPRLRPRGPAMIRVETGSRLHFGLFHLGSEESWPNVDGEPVVPTRRFGGVGLMVDSPGILLAVEPAPAWSASGPLAERALEFARRFASSLVAQELSPRRLTVERA